MNDLQKNQAEAQAEHMRAWQEFGRPLAGSTVGHPPQAPKNRSQVEQFKIGHGHKADGRKNSVLTRPRVA